MPKISKYAYNVEQEGSVWTAQITRRVTSKKTIISKQQEAFASEADAKQWAEQQLLEFTTTLGVNNQRHAEHRKLSEETRRQRSNRRAEKTEKIKLEKIAQAQPFEHSEEDEPDQE